MKEKLIGIFIGIFVVLCFTIGSGMIISEGYEVVKSIIIDKDTGAFAKVNSDGQLHTVLESKADTNNATEVALGANNAWTGTVTELASFNAISLFVETDVASATKGLTVQYSNDGVDWHIGEAYTIPAGAEKFYSPPPWMNYYRIAYTNGASPQSDFHIHTVLHKTMFKPSSHNVDDNISDEDDAELAINVIKAKKPNGSYQSIGSSTDGNLLVHDAENPSAIAFGDVEGKATVQKFGNAPDFDTDDGQITVWDGASDSPDIDVMQYVYSVTADIDSVISSDTGDLQDVEIQGLGASSNLVVQTVTLNGQTRVALATNLYRVFRVKNVGTSNFTGDVSCYVTNAPTSGGIPTDTSLIRAHVQDGNNQTEMAIYTVPADKEVVIHGLYWYSAGANKSSTYVCTLWARPPGGVFQLKWKGAFNDDIQSGLFHPFKTGLYFDEGTDIELRVESIASPAIAGAAISGGFEIEMKDK